MNENKYTNKIIITMQEMMQQMDISDKTLHRMIEEGELPDFTYGSRCSKKKGWHTAVLERHAMEKYEHSASFKNVSNTGKVVAEDMGVMPLGNCDRTVTQKKTDLDDRNTLKKELSRKKVSGGVRSASQSRIATGFSDMPS